METIKKLIFIVFILISMTSCGDIFNKITDCKNTINSLKEDIEKQVYAKEKEIAYFENLVAIRVGCEWLVNVCPDESSKEVIDAKKHGYTGVFSLSLWTLLLLKTVIFALLFALTYSFARLLWVGIGKADEEEVEKGKKLAAEGQKLLEEAQKKAAEAEGRARKAEERVRGAEERLAQLAQEAEELEEEKQENLGHVQDLEKKIEDTKKIKKTLDDAFD